MATNNGADEFVEMSTGVIFKLVKAPSGALAEIYRRNIAGKPKVPIVFIANKGRKEENPSDPDYHDALEDFEVQMNMAMYDAAILLGTEVKSVPEGFTAVEDDSWVENYALLGVLPQGDPPPRARYLAWVKFLAAPTEEDMKTLSDAVAKRHGALEEEVEAAQATFPGDQGGEPDRESSPPGGN